MGKVNSTAIDSIEWSNGTLTVRFHDGLDYAYPGVPEDLYHAFLEADSKGRFFNQFIRGRFFTH